MGFFRKLNHHDKSICASLFTESFPVLFFSNIWQLAHEQGNTCIITALSDWQSLLDAFIKEPLLITEVTMQADVALDKQSLLQELEVGTYQLW